MMAVTKPPREKERISVMATDMPTAVDVPMQAPHEAMEAHDMYYNNYVYLLNGV